MLVCILKNVSVKYFVYATKKDVCLYKDNEDKSLALENKPQLFSEFV